MLKKAFALIILSCLLRSRLGPWAHLPGLLFHKPVCCQSGFRELEMGAA